MERELVWENPPPTHAKATFDEERAAMRANPGRWLRLRTYSRSGTASKAVQHLKEQGFEAVIRSNTVYARWPEGVSR